MKYFEFTFRTQPCTRYNAHRHKVQANLTFYTRIAVSLYIIHQH